MISWRLAASLTPPNAILVPGTTPRGSARYLSRLAWFQTRPDSFIASLKSKPGTSAAFSPQIPASDGPMPFLPGSTEWQALHWANAAGSAAAAAGVGEADALGVGAGVGVAPAAALEVASGAAVSAGVAVSVAPGSGSVSAAAGVSVGAAPVSSGLPPHADRAKIRASAVVDVAANFMEGLSFKTCRRAPYRRKSASGRPCGTQAAPAKQIPRRAASHFRPAVARPIRAGFMFDAPPSTWRGEAAATLRIAAPLAAANLLQMLVYAMDVI